MLSFSGWRGVAYSSSGVAATTLQDCKRPAFTKQSFPCFPFAFFRVFRGQFLLFPLASFAGWGTIMMDPPNLRVFPAISSKPEPAVGRRSARTGAAPGQSRI
jgi:hypothetical protein